MYSMLTQKCIISEPEVWLACLIQLLNFCLRNPKALYNQQITKTRLFSLYRISRERPEFEYFRHTVEYFFIKIGLKYLTMRMYEEALYFAIEMNSTPLLNQIRILANRQKNVFI